MDRSTCGKTYWCCINYYSHHCRSRLHTRIITNNVVKPPTDHICKFDGTTLELRGVIISEVRVSKIQVRGYPEKLKFLSAFGVTP